MNDNNKTIIEKKRSAFFLLILDKEVAGCKQIYSFTYLINSYNLIFDR